MQWVLKQCAHNRATVRSCYPIMQHPDKPSKALLQYWQEACSLKLATPTSPPGHQATTHVTLGWALPDCCYRRCHALHQ